MRQRAQISRRKERGPVFASDSLLRRIPAEKLSRSFRGEFFMWAVIVDIGPKHAGVLHGMSNTAGTFAAIISTMGIGLFIERLGSFQSFLTLTSIMYIASTVFWLKQ